MRYFCTWNIRKHGFREAYETLEFVCPRACECVRFAPLATAETITRGSDLGATTTKQNLTAREYDRGDEAFCINHPTISTIAGARRYTAISRTTISSTPGTATPTATPVAAYSSSLISARLTAAAPLRHKCHRALAGRRLSALPAPKAHSACRTRSGRPGVLQRDRVDRLRRTKERQ